MFFSVSVRMKVAKQDIKSDFDLVQYREGWEQQKKVLLCFLSWRVCHLKFIGSCSIARVTAILNLLLKMLTLKYLQIKKQHIMLIL